MKTERSLVVTIAVVVLRTLVALSLGEVAIFLHSYAAGNCDE